MNVLNGGIWCCLKRERDIGTKATLSDVKTAFGWNPALSRADLFTGASRRLEPVIKFQSISVVFSTLHCEGYIADLRYRWPIASGSARWFVEILSAILKSTRHGGQSTERSIAFGGTTRSPAFTMHKFMCENLRVNIWRDNFTSDYGRVNLPSRNLSRM